MHVVVNTSSLHVYKKYRITSLLCIIETLVYTQFLIKRLNQLISSKSHCTYHIKCTTAGNEQNMKPVHIAQVSQVSYFVHFLQLSKQDRKKNNSS